MGTIVLDFSNLTVILNNDLKKINNETIKRRKLWTIRKNYQYEKQWGIFIKQEISNNKLKNIKQEIINNKTTKNEQHDEDKKKKQ